MSFWFGYFQRLIYSNDSVWSHVALHTIPCQTLFPWSLLSIRTLPYFIQSYYLYIISSQMVFACSAPLLFLSTSSYPSDSYVEISNAPGNSLAKCEHNAVSKLFLERIFLRCFSLVMQLPVIWGLKILCLHNLDKTNHVEFFSKLFLDGKLQRHWEAFS